MCMCVRKYNLIFKLWFYFDTFNSGIFALRLFSEKDSETAYVSLGLLEIDQALNIQIIVVTVTKSNNCYS